MSTGDVTVYPSIETEKFVLSSMLLKDGENVKTVASLLTAEDFYRPEHRTVYSAILSLVAKGTTPNLLSLSQELQQTGKLNHSGASELDITFVLSLGSIAHTNAYTELYCNQIKECANQRRIINFAEKIKHNAESNKFTYY